MEDKNKAGAHIHINGIVQGVGFRPFVFGLANRLNLTGWVRNTSAGVDIQVDGDPAAIEFFTMALKEEAPPLAKIDSLEWKALPANGFLSFEIIASASIDTAFQPISPDVCICPDCLQELFDPSDRRYLYPFINCTNCGPRFTIIADIPYDRPNTTMANFALCPACAAEYADPLDRRFHAQPVACPVCGPQVWLERCPEDWETDRNDRTSDAMPAAPGLKKGIDAILQARRLLSQGSIVAIKGLGGFHLACDATNPTTVDLLRQRKLRVDKPFAVMLPDLNAVEKHCFLNDTERELLTSRARPIVILRRRPDSSIAAQVAPGQKSLGVMLPYTPLHYLIVRQPTGVDKLESETGPEYPSALVMTSGNLSEEPIATGNVEALARLSHLADAFLMHDRPIQTRCDDSVVQVFLESPGKPSGKTAQNASLMPIRRSRGYTPFPVRLSAEVPPLLATGAELKNIFCLTRGQYAFLSHHIGDLENFETLRSFEEGITHFERLFRLHPEALAYDLHPDYLSTRYALARAERTGLPAFGVQHHHAHMAACLIENQVPSDQPVIGVIFDGTGYGTDGKIWGGEFLLGGYTEYQRYAHLKYALLPGGDTAIRKPARIALAYLWQAGLSWESELPPVKAVCAADRQALLSMLTHQINTPATSSMGRLFDAVAALLGVRQTINYEAQAAIEMEALVDPGDTGFYPFDLIQQPAPQDQSAHDRCHILIDPATMFDLLVTESMSGLPISSLAARFHNSVARMVLQVCLEIRNASGVNAVALSGGVWQNRCLLEKTLGLLASEKFIIYTHHQVPPNDGGLALGQAIVGLHKII